jgi:hypothetical protein
VKLRPEATLRRRSGLVRRAIVGGVTGLLLGALPPLGVESRTQNTQRGVQIVLSSSHEHHRDRIERAAAESLRQYELWLGFPLRDGVVIRDTGTGAVGTTAEVPVDLPWLAAPETMEIEAAVAHGLAMQYWPHDDRAADLITGLSWYLQGRVVERLFNVSVSQPGHSVDGTRFFGGTFPWAFRSLRNSRWSDSLRRTRSAAAFAALERYLSWPVLQGALRALAADAQNTPVSVDRAVEVLGAAAGQDLKWFFDVALDTGASIDYGLSNLEVVAGSACAATPCIRSRVTARRHGNAAFTGTSQQPSGPYDAGSGIVIEMQFSDGSRSIATWDGRATDRTFEFEGLVAATRVRLDPEGTLLLDPTRGDHSLNATAQSNVPVVKWAARWMVWLQDALLAYAALV